MKRAVGHNLAYIVITNNIVEMVFTKAAQAFGNLLMGCILNINTVLTTVEKWKFTFKQSTYLCVILIMYNSLSLLSK